MSGQIIFKKLTKDHYPLFLSWAKKYSAHSFFAISTPGGLTTIDLQIREKDPGNQVFLVLEDKLKGIVKITAISTESHNAAFSLFIPEDTAITISYIDMFIKSFCQNNAINKLETHIFSDEREAQKQLIALGFEQEGLLKEQFFARKKFLDIMVFGKFME